MAKSIRNRMSDTGIPGVFEMLFRAKKMPPRSLPVPDMRTGKRPPPFRENIKKGKRR